MTSFDVSSDHAVLRLSLAWTDDSPVRLGLTMSRDARSAPDRPLVEILAAGHGRTWAGRRLVDTTIGARLRHESHDLRSADGWSTVRVTQVDGQTGLRVTSELSLHDTGLRSVTRVHNDGGDAIALHAVSSLVFADFSLDDAETLETMTLLRGTNDWLAEGRWTTTDLRSAGLPRLQPHDGAFRTRGCIQASSESSWSTAADAPTIAISSASAERRWSFQLEHNGAWVWQVGEVPDGLYVAMFGPTDELHQWQVRLEPGQSFVSVPASVTVESAEPVDGLGALTAFRRASAGRDTRTEAESLPVVFNDYMNTVNGDPTAARLLPLIDAAADAGSDVFVIDAGWYAEDGDWWDTVGEWQPSGRRFPDGIDTVLDHIRRRGMIAGLWLEPEVVGVRSPMASKLPDEAFLSRGGVRTVEHGRYHLDYSSAFATAFLDEVVDRLVDDLGVGYFKFDYNIRAGAGSDNGQPSPGHGLLRHNRAYLAWVDRLRARHPDLMLENCASGGMREDFATVSRFDLQSTSDQEDFLSYPPIAASAPMLVPPEQSANWSYPQPGMSDDDVVFTLCTSLLGRLYLSGWLFRLTEAQRAVVASAVAVHRRLLPAIVCSVPVWPLGLPGWTDPWIALGLLRADRGVTGEAGDAGDITVYLTVWHRPGADPGGTTEQVELPLPTPPPGYRWASPTAVFPDTSPLAVSLSGSGDVLIVRHGGSRPAARVVSLMAELR